MTSPIYWDEARAYLKKKDKKLGKVIDAYTGEMLVTKGDAFFTLARAITGQQISVKAADSVWTKLTSSVGKITPEVIGNTDATILRACGLSASKVLYLHALANHFLENKALIKQWPNMSDDEIIRELTSIKGIGRWTAEMFLIFHLGRPDVFPVADIGLQKGIYRLYNKDNPMTMEEIKAIGEKWRPYRSVATWYLWRSLDPVPVAY